MRTETERSSIFQVKDFMARFSQVTEAIVKTETEKKFNYFKLRICVTRFSQASESVVKTETERSSKI